MAKTVVYLICIDNGLIVCNSKDNKCILPCIIFEETFKTRNDVKKAIIDKTHLKINRGDLQYLGNPEEELYFYSVVIDLNRKGNETILHSSGFKDAKGLRFISCFKVDWDDGSKIALDTFFTNKNFKNAFAFINSDDKFNFYSKETKKTISRVFNLVTNIWQYDRPDVVVETKNGVTGVEFFQINAAGKNEYGSIGTIGKKEMEKELYKGKLGEINTVTKHFSNSLDNLWTDFKERFEDHCSKLSVYHERLRKIYKESEIAIGFFVDDTTLLGSYYREKGIGMTMLYMFNLQEFWDLFLKVKELSFVIFQQTESDYDKMFFITKDDYSDLLSKNQIYKKEEIESIFFDEPHLIGAPFLISK